MADEPLATALPQNAATDRLPRLLSHPLLHAMIVVAIVLLGWIIATQWDRWTGAGRFQRSEDAFVTGDRIPLSTQVSGYVRRVAVDDNQSVGLGQLIAEVEPSDYQAQRDLAQANLAAARANLAGTADKRAVQRALAEHALQGEQARAAEPAVAVDLDLRPRYRRLRFPRHACDIPEHADSREPAFTFRARQGAAGHGNANE